MLVLTVATVSAICLSLSIVNAFDNASDSTTDLVCPSTHFGCKNAYKCVEKKYMCNKRDDCGDGSDEDLTTCILKGKVPAQLTCASNEFQCKNGFRCVRIAYQCDNDNDCGDNSDEDPNECIRAGLYDHNVTCADIGFICGAGTGPCISRNKLLCNGKNDCGDNADEDLSNCRAKGVVKDELSYAQLMNLDVKMNSSVSQRRFSVTMIMTALMEAMKTLLNALRRGLFQKAPHVLILASSAGIRLMEVSALAICSSVTARTIAAITATRTLKSASRDRISQRLRSFHVVRLCGNDRFHCGKKCASKKFLCDSYVGCPGGSDEDPVICLNRTRARKCMSHKFKCKNNKCIDKEYICDGDDDCGDMSDEGPKICSSRDRTTTTRSAARSSQSPPSRKRPLICKRDQFKCLDGSKCIRNTSVCDRKRHCDDGSDERLEACIRVEVTVTGAPSTPNPAVVSCEEPEFMCTDRLNCIPIAYACNGSQDCDNGSDEDPSICLNSSSQRPALKVPREDTDKLTDAGHGHLYLVASTAAALVFVAVVVLFVVKTCRASQRRQRRF